MPLPILWPGAPPTDKPATANIASRGTGISGGGSAGGGLTPNPIRAGVNIAFGSTPSSEAPLWQLLEELGPT